MKRDMVDSNYLDELLEGIPDELFDGNYCEEDLLKMVDLPMESFAIDGEFDVNESHDSWQSLASFYGGCRPVDSVVWNTQIDSKPNLNCSVPLPDPILSDTSVGLPVFIEDNVMNMKHITGNTVSDTLVEVKPRRLPLNDLIMESGSILGLPQVVENQVMNHTRTRDNGVSYGMESGPMIMPMNGLISKTEPIPSAASFGLPRVGDDMAIKHTTGSVVSDTLLESKPNLIPTNWLVTKSRPMLVDATIGSPRGVECKVSNHTVGYAHTDIIPEIPANGKAKVLDSGSSRIQSPVSVLDNTSSCNSCQTSMSTIKPRGSRYGKRSERPRPKHIKTSWFHITLMPPAVFSKKTSTNQKREKKRKSQEIEKENKLYSFACWKKQTMASQGTKKCSHCEVTKTPQWREGPNGPKTLCNACGVRYRSGRLYPEYRPAASPTFTPILHSNSHRKVIEMRKQQTLPENKLIDTTTEQDSEGMDPPRSHDSMLIENVQMIGHPFELIY